MHSVWESWPLSPSAQCQHRMDCQGSSASLGGYLMACECRSPSSTEAPPSARPPLPWESSCRSGWRSKDHGVASCHSYSTTSASSPGVRPRLLHVSGLDVVVLAELAQLEATLEARSTVTPPQSSPRRTHPAEGVEDCQAHHAPAHDGATRRKSPGIHTQERSASWRNTSHFEA